MCWVYEICLRSFLVPSQSPQNHFPPFITLFGHFLGVSTSYIIFHFFSPIFPYSPSFFLLFCPCSSPSLFLPSSHSLPPMTISSLHFPKLSEHSCIDWLWPEFPSSGLARGKCSFQFVPSLARNRKVLRV